MIAHEVELPPFAPNEVTDKASPLAMPLGFLGQLKVTVQVGLGQADIEVEQLLAMQQGETVVLDREVDAPVDLLVNGLVVARGTLVAVGEHLGVRLTELPTLHGVAGA